KRFRQLTRSKTISEDQLRKAIVRQTGAQTKLAKAKAALKSNQQERQYTHLSSPVRAQVRERLQDPGDLAGTRPILRLDVLGGMELEVYIPSTRLGDIVVGQKMDVTIQSGSTPLTGKVARIVHAADKVTRRNKVRIALPDHQSLIPGQFGQAQIVLRETLLNVIPLEAITQRAGIEGVFIVDELKTAHFRSIRTGRIFKENLEILAGPEEGTMVVLNPSATLHEGDHVTPLSRHEG
ncbi:MAG: efflux RND transporter periplasmic adaptor subunit, partial [Methylococcales bacterium]|nr:efflux RND transporter periplasmic adaptor subunit [Methylococcales bacterium]